MERENRNLKVLVVILCILVLGLGGYFVYDKMLSDDTNNEIQNDNNKIEIECEESYTYEDIEGYYSGNIFAENLESMSDDGSYGENVSYSLYLWKDGIFKYSYSAYAPEGWIGNYIIDGNTIILNYLYKTNSGAGFVVTKGSNKLMISDDGNILNYNYEFKDRASKEYAELVKDTTGKEISKLDSFELRNIGPYEVDTGN